MYKLLNRYLGRTAMLMAPEGVGGGTGGGAGNGDFNQNGNGGSNSDPNDGGDDDPDPFESNGDDDEPLDDDMKDILKSFGVGDDDDDDDGSQQSLGSFKDASPEEIAALEKDIERTIGSMRIPDNLIPEDFDPTTLDRAGFMNILNGAHKAALAHSLQVVFKPVQLAMQTMANQIDTRVDSKISASQKGQHARSILEEIVPEIKDKRYSGLVTSMDAALSTKGKNPRQRAQTIRKILNQMGIKGNAKATGKSDPMAPTVKRGSAMLDGLFGKAPKF